MVDAPRGTVDLEGEFSFTVRCLRSCSWYRIIETRNGARKPHIRYVQRHPEKMRVDYHIYSETVVR